MSFSNLQLDLADDKYTIKHLRIVVAVAFYSLHPLIPCSLLVSLSQGWRGGVVRLPFALPVWEELIWSAAHYCLYTVCVLFSVWEMTDKSRL